MAVEVESGSQVEEFLRVLRRRAWWIAIPTIVVIAIGTAFAVIVPKKYVVKTAIMVRNRVVDASVASGASFDEVRNAQHHLKSTQRIIQVLDALQWTDYLQLPRADIDAYVQKIANALKVDAPPTTGRETSQVVKIQFSHTDPKRCLDFLKRTSDSWRNDVLERGRNAEAQNFELLLQRKRDKEALRDELDDSLRELRQRFQIDPSVQSGRNVLFRPSDPVFARAYEEEATLAESEQELATLELEVERKQQRHDAMPPSIVNRYQGAGGVEHEKEIGELRASITAKKEEQKRYKAEHSKYKNLQRDIDAITLQIRQLEEGEQDPVTAEQEIPNSDKLKLAKELEDDRMELAQLRDRVALQRDRLNKIQVRMNELTDAYRNIEGLEAEKALLELELATLVEEIERRKPAHDLLMGPQGNPFDVLDEPRLPGRPSEPDPLIIVIFSIFMGLGAGLALAVLTEYSKSCFRSVHDVSRVMVAPVLGAINTIATRRDRLRVRATHALVGGATLVFVGTLAFVTWAWAVKPGILSTGLRGAIEDLRESLE